MKHFNKKISENTIPLILYLVSSFLVVFVSNLNFILISLLLFLFVSTILFNRRIVQKIIIISIIVISLVLFVSMLITLNFKTEMILLSLPKSITLSIIVTSTIAFFVYLPTIQLLYITKTITRSNYAAYGVLTAFRTFPVFFSFSKKIFITIKIRKAYSSYFDFILLYIQNIFIEFVDFLDNFIRRITFIELDRIKIKLTVNHKTLLTIIYLLTIITLIAYEK